MRACALLISSRARAYCAPSDTVCSYNREQDQSKPEPDDRTTETTCSSLLHYCCGCEGRSKRRALWTQRVAFRAKRIRGTGMYCHCVVYPTSCSCFATHEPSSREWRTHRQGTQGFTRTPTLRRGFRQRCHALGDGGRVVPCTNSERAAESATTVTSESPRIVWKETVREETAPRHVCPLLGRAVDMITCW